MTIISNPVTGSVLGQPLSPYFGVQFAGSPTPAGNPVAPPPGMPLLEAVSRGILPRNADASSISGVSTGAQNPTPIDDLMSNGAGNQVNAGTAINSANGNPATNGANDQQIFVDGVSTLNAGLSTGPTPTSTETLTSCPVSGNTFCANVTLSGTFQG